MALEPRRVRRSNLSTDNRVEAAESDLDEVDARLDEVDARQARLAQLVIGAIITVATMTIMLAINIVVVGK